MNVYMNRFSEQVETVTTQTLVDSWPEECGSEKRHEREAFTLRAILLPKETRNGQSISKEWFDGFL